jgi:hypothetical protein
MQATATAMITYCGDYHVHLKEALSDLRQKIGEMKEEFNSCVKLQIQNKM